MPHVVIVQKKWKKWQVTGMCGMEWTGFLALWGFKAKCVTRVDGWIPLRLFSLLEHLRCLKIRPYGKKMNQYHLTLSSQKISVIWKQNWLLQSRFLWSFFSHHQNLYFTLFSEAVNQKCCSGRNYFGSTSLTSSCTKSGWRDRRHYKNTP